MQKINIAVIGAGARGMYAYAPYLLDNPGEGKIVGVAEPDRERREAFCKKYDVPSDKTFNSWDELLAVPKFCDAVIIATLDDMHFEPAMRAMELGYDILLEKPISVSPHECMKLAEKANETGAKVVVCHVLRYTSFYRELKKQLKSGIIGDIVSVVHNENVAFFHQAHSFVRGNWKNSDETCPMILAKCCHDMDLLNWLIDSECMRLSSFGSLMHFKPENAPAGATEYCLDGCAAAETCPYYVMRYRENRSCHKGFMFYVCEPEPVSEEVFLRNVKNGRYGRCVYKCDNNVVDHQVVNMEYEHGTTVAFTMSAFTDKGSRTTKIMGTKGEIAANDLKKEIIIYDFLSGNTTTIVTADTTGGHGGGDSGIMKDFLAYVRGDRVSDSMTTIQVSVASHNMAFAAEKSRLENTVIETGSGGLKL